ncbi:MAG: chloride channel protein [Acetobacteraceae bacterium]
MQRKSDTPATRPHLHLGDIVVHAPQALRALVRADELWLVALAAVIGVLAGLAVVVMEFIAQLMHRYLFNLPGHAHLSGVSAVSHLNALLVPSLGGLAFGLIGLVVVRYFPGRVVDPIEANALHGGRMSLRDSLIMTGQTILSNGVGASVGMESGYAQIGGATGSYLGRMFRVRRSDLRLLVGCGAGAAIGGAFNAPLTGAFYGFELIIGTYSIPTLAPVMVSSVVAVLIERQLGVARPPLELIIPSRISTIGYLPILGLGLLCALIGILVMRGATLTESLFRQSGVPAWLRPTIGGLLVGSFGVVTPHVMSSGHAALPVVFGVPFAISFVALMLLMKAAATSISIGSGFRGGLFFASLFLGALVGKLSAELLALVTPFEVMSPTVGMVVGMSALAATIVGGPLTMAFLALETTGSLPLTAAVLASSVIAALTTRRLFGYNFATWRFHLRGEVIRSAVDIGWMRNLTVMRMMRRDVRTVRADTTVSEFRREFPPGSTPRVVAVDSEDAYAGIVLVAEAHATPLEVWHLSEILHCPYVMLLPQMTVKEAATIFEQAETDALAVVDDLGSKRVIGLLTEQYALRRYSEELERQRRQLSGE